MKFIFKYLNPYKRRLIVGFTIKTVGTFIELALPFILSYILDTVIPESGKIHEIVLWGLSMILCALIALICNVVANRMAAYTARVSAEKIRHDLFDRIMRLSGRQIDRFTLPSLESRITTDTYNVHSFTGMMQRLGVRAPLLLIGGIAVSLILDPFLALVMLALMPFVFAIIFFVSKKGIPMYTKVQNSVDGMVRVVREDSAGIRVIKALSKTDYENRRYDNVNKKLVKNELKAGLTMGTVNPALNFLMNLGIVFVVLIGAYRVMGLKTEPGKIVAFTQYFTMISTALISITRIFIMYTKSSASAKRIAEVIDTPPDLVVYDESLYPKRDDSDFIVFDDVCFSYNGKTENLSHISFSIPKGSSLGIIGHTGSGKTTIVNLLTRFYDADSGSVRIDGRDIRTIESEPFRKLFGVAMQNDFLYADTIKENIKFGRDLSFEEIRRAAIIAQADDFISALPDGYDQSLAQKGVNVSGGQKQRLLIARAVAASPDIIILDDSSSALDFGTDLKLRKALKENLTDSTKIIVAQRVSSVRNCEQIIVLEEGGIIGKGTHEELTASCPVYREIAESQMGGAFLD